MSVQVKAPNMTKHFKLEIRCSSVNSKENRRLGGHGGERVLLFCIVEWRLFLVIFHFGRLKFERDPVVDSKVNPNF